MHCDVAWLLTNKLFCFFLCCCIDSCLQHILAIFSFSSSSSGAVVGTGAVETHVHAEDSSGGGGKIDFDDHDLVMDIMGFDEDR